MADDYKPGAPSVWDILKKLKGAGNELPPSAQNPLLGNKGGIPVPRVIGWGTGAPAKGGVPGAGAKLPSGGEPAEKLPWSAPQVKIMGGYTPPKPRVGPDFDTQDVINMLKDEGASVVGKYKAPGTGSRYIFYNAKGKEDKDNWQNNYTIRLPDPNNPHPGSIYSTGGGLINTPAEENPKAILDKATRFIDTTGFGKQDTLKNANGQFFSDPRILRDTVRWQMQQLDPNQPFKLVPPGSKPLAARDRIQQVTTTPPIPDPNQMQFIDQLLAEQQKPNAIVGGNPQNYFSSSQLGQRQNLNAPSDFNFADPYLMGSPANMNKDTRALSPDVESHIQALRNMLFYGKAPNGQEE